MTFSQAQTILGTMSKKTNLPQGVSLDRDRHGNARYYFRTTGRPKVRLHEAPGTREFDQEIACARLGIPYSNAKAPQISKNAAAKGSLDWLVQEYNRRAASQVSADLMGRRVRMLEEVCDSRTKKYRRGDLPYAAMQKRHITEIRDELRTTPGAQNNIVKSLSALFFWAGESGLSEKNPAHGIRRLDADQSYHAWTVEEVEQFEKHHPMGSTARLFLHLGLFTGLRISDLAILGKQHIQNGWLVIRPGKTRKSSGVLVEIPLLPVLKQTIDASPTGDLTLLLNAYGRAFTEDGLGNRVRKWCDAAGLPHCSAHGLRKAGATMAAENGATDNELMAIFGWTTKQQTTLYTKHANRRKLAGNAIHKLLPDQVDAEQNRVEFVPPKLGLEKVGQKTPKRSMKSKTEK